MSDQSFQQKWQNRDLSRITEAELAEYQQDMTQNAFLEDGLEQMRLRQQEVSPHYRQLLFGGAIPADWTFAPQKPVAGQKLGYKDKKEAKKAKKQTLANRRTTLISNFRELELQDVDIRNRDVLRDNDFGYMTNILVKEDPRVQLYAERNARLLQQHPELKEGSNETRDCAQFIGEGFVSDEHMAEVKRNLIILKNADHVKDEQGGDLPHRDTQEHRRKAANALLPVYNNTFNEVYRKMQGIGAFSPKPFYNDDDILDKAYECAYIYKQVQIMQMVGKGADFLIPLSKRSFINATSRYCMNMVNLANLMGKTDKANKAQYEKEKKKMNFQGFYNEAMERDAPLEADKKAFGY